MCLLHQRPGTRCRRIARIPALAAPKHDREGDQRQLIDEACGKQRLVKHAAALDEQVRSIAGLERRDSRGRIADEALAVVPRQRPVGRCYDILSNGIERLADRLVAVVGPVSGEDLVGSPAKQQLIATAQQPPHRLGQRAVEMGEHPAAVRKAGLVLLRPAWCLDHAVERLEKGADDLTHRRLLRAPQPRSGRCQSCASSSSLRMLAGPRPCEDCCWPALAASRAARSGYSNQEKTTASSSFAWTDLRKSVTLPSGTSSLQVWTMRVAPSSRIRGAKPVAWSTYASLLAIGTAAMNPSM